MNLHDESFVQKMLAAWNAHDVDGAMALMMEDCVWEIPRGSAPHGTLFQGANEVRAAIADAFRAIPDIQYQSLRSCFGSGHVVMELLVTGTLADGTAARFHACDILTMVDGKIAAKRSYRKVAG
ncbi:nuclear transport factor 2 family protein [Reyranella sp. CPCC 100927]|uniref:nuclear transport factor 2 family protein n=1 Tax=Reyranella sp. CPCC 100927 TaxID=2599616 RepID=UPI0011B4DD87|nr:nuclear transport factor 2 family protein [Reyranella sp. CPCC 100927]TWS99399.1 nuclear transport factor 2 family protein [Reyranella sp. CPCC 100927]